jgi:hypothetical protein
MEYPGKERRNHMLALSIISTLFCVIVLIINIIKLVNKKRNDSSRE